MRKILCLIALLPCAAFAADDPETVYGKLHRATLAGSVEEVLSYATEVKRKEMAALAGKEDMVRMMAMTLPKTYSVTKRDIDARKAHLEFRGVHDSGPSRGSADFVKEKGAWKVDEWSWQVLAQAPAAPQQEPAKETKEKPPAQPITAEPLPAPVDAPTLRKQTAETAPCIIKPVMSDEDLRRCGATPPKYDN
ncbi:MAG: hypothetical protein ACT4P3_10890 [Betaproteobacteria bacterium]